MTNQEKKRELKKYRSLDQHINSLLVERRMWFDRATKITPNMDGMPQGSGQGDKISSAVIKIVELDQKINDEIDRLIETREKIMGAIKNVDDERFRALLIYRYIDGMTWEQIALETHYSYMQVCRLHGLALEKIML